MKSTKRTITLILITIFVLMLAVCAYFVNKESNRFDINKQNDKFRGIHSYLTELTSLNTAGFPLETRALRGTLYHYEKKNADSKYIYDIPLNPDYQIMNVDFTALKARNTEVTGFLDFESPDMDIISYPVMYREGSDFYLNHNIDQVSDVNGTLYIEGGILGGHSKTNTIIYGHNMRAGVMFGTLKKYMKAEFYSGREFFWLYTPEGKFRYQIFAVHPAAYDGYTFTWFANPCPEYTQFLLQSKQDQYYETGVTPMPDDEIITLCTCTNSDSTRLVVQGRLVYKDIKQENTNDKK